MVGRVEAHCREGGRLHVPEPLLIAVAVLFVGAVAASYVDRLGAPTLLLFLGLGMLLGENRPGGIAFDNAVLSRDASTVALIVILLEGGLLAEREHVRRAAPAGAMLSTVGVLVTAAPSSRRPTRPRSSQPSAASTCASGSARSSRPRAGSTTRSRRCS